jgi:hypothetical protein
VSTILYPSRPIPFEKLKEFDRNGVCVDSAPDSNSLIPTDGVNYLWAIKSSESKYKKKTGTHQTKVIFIRYAGNRPEKIIGAIEQHFKTKLITEYSE